MIIKIRKVFTENTTSIEAEKIIFAKGVEVLSVNFGVDDTSIIMKNNFVVKAVSAEKDFIVMNE